ncbi:NAD(P)-dependent oxidoreductase [Spirosoma endophyticum]|nr:SDR family oxidoreductase [Spirosoma endophyticum]
MQLLVLGATGGTGKQTVEQALERGHYVTAFVRNPTKLSIQHPNLTVLTGDVLKPETLVAAVRRQDAVICSLGSKPGQKDHPVADGTVNLIDAMQHVGVRRLLVVSSMGVGSSYEEMNIIGKVLMNTLLRSVMAEKEKQEQAVQQSNLDWLIVRPTNLTNGPITGQYKVGEHLPFSTFAFPHISRADVAAFMLDQLDNDTYLRKAVTITER